MRIRAVVVGAVALAALAWPVVRRPPTDSFPLSTYPMFTQERPRVTAVDLAVGVDDTGGDVRLDPGLVGGTVEVIQAVATVGRAISDGSADDLCAEVAERVGRSGRDEVVEILVVTDRYDVVEALVDPGPPQDRLVHARCEVPR